MAFFIKFIDHVVKDLRPVSIDVTDCNFIHELHDRSFQCTDGSPCSSDSNMLEINHL